MISTKVLVYVPHRISDVMARMRYFVSECNYCYRSACSVTGNEVDYEKSY